MTPLWPPLYALLGLLALLAGLRLWARRGVLRWLAGVALVAWGIDAVRVLVWIGDESHRPWMRPAIYAAVGALVARAVWRQTRPVPAPGRS